MANYMTKDDPKILIDNLFEAPDSINSIED